MNNNDIPTDKNQQAEEQMAEMLRAIEHAGRNSRRQQQLSDLIDQLAAEKATVAHHHNRKRWAIAFSAAACIALFVTTIVKFIYTPSTMPKGGVIVAQNDNDSIVMNDDIVLIENPENGDTIAYAPLHAAPKGKTLLIAQHEEVLQETRIEEVMENEVEDKILEDIKPELFLAEGFESEERDPIESIVTPVVSIGNNEEKTTSTAKVPEKKRRGLLRIFRSEPSKMDGTMLAFRIM